MESKNIERRNAPRYQVSAKVVVRGEHGEAAAGMAVNISTSGMLVRLDRPVPFRLGDTVTVDVELPAGSDYAFSSWGIAEVVRVDGEGTAMHLSAGSFHPDGS